MTWTLQLNGFFICSLGSRWEGNDCQSEGGTVKHVPIAGIAISVAGLIGAIAANLAIKDLRAKWKTDGSFGAAAPPMEPLSATVPGAFLKQALRVILFHSTA